MQAFVSNKKEYLLFFGIIILFFALRLPAIHAPYHQDEYKWPIIVNPELTEPGVIPHPPLSEAIYRATRNFFGDENFRVTPLIFSLINLTLIYIIVRRRYGVGAALWSSLFFALSFFSVLASLMIDTDGAVLPFFFLLSILFYDYFSSSTGNKKFLFGGLLVAALILGMLVKFSFALVIGALILDFVWNHKEKLNRKNILYALSGLISFAVLVALLMFVAQKLFPGFDLQKIIAYSETFMKGFGSRNFFQSGIQFVKALFYLSPFLVLSFLISLLVPRSFSEVGSPYSKDLKLFHLFLALGLIFYLILFDFSAGALDRYFQFMIVPLCIIAGVFSAENFLSSSPSLLRRHASKIIFLLCVFFVFLTQFLDQYVPALHPKAEWIDRILSFNWNFLYPFSGGSGPLTFYVSFIFIALSWILGAVFTGLYLWKKNLQKEIWVAFLILGLFYNAVFIE